MSQTFLIIVLMGENITEEQVISKCAIYNCEATRVYDSDEYEIRSDDPINFFWLGMNWDNELRNQLLHAK